MKKGFYDLDKPPKNDSKNIVRLIALLLLIGLLIYGAIIYFGKDSGEVGTQKQGKGIEPVETEDVEKPAGTNSISPTITIDDAIANTKYKNKTEVLEALDCIKVKLMSKMGNKQEAAFKHMNFADSFIKHIDYDLPNLINAGGYATQDELLFHLKEYYNPEEGDDELNLKKCYETL